jgi:ribonuclease HI
LLVKQMRGQYKVKSEDLRPLFECAKKMSATFDAFRIAHVYREQNKDADALANEALDETSGATPASAMVKGPKSAGSSASPAEESSGAAATASTPGKSAAPAKPAPKPDTSGIPRKVRARFRSGILYPLEDLDLEDGCEVEIYLRATPKKERL